MLLRSIIHVEGGLKSSLHGSGTELEFHSLHNKVSYPLKGHIPDVLVNEILFN
uniref:Uncharacterized protein n=1 Tax=Nelumbo nucifera TaxID=4432 RepID=A0A822Y9C8_NELNU|nr:TPA_asm: hypothetical protein HUJ06_030608 [Nelumbo nucifera]